MSDLALLEGAYFDLFRRAKETFGLEVMHHPSHNATPTMHQEHASSQIQAYRNGIIVDTEVQTEGVESDSYKSCFECFVLE